MYSKTTLNIVTDAVVLAAKDSLGNKLDKVILYGSYARGDFDGESDIDILILADIPQNDELKEYQKINRFISRLGLEHDVLITVNLTSSSTFYKFANDLPFFVNVQREGVVLSA